MPRFRIQTLMILVAVTALFFWDATAHPVLFRRECLVQRRQLVRVQIVHHQQLS